MLINIRWSNLTYFSKWSNWDILIICNWIHVISKFVNVLLKGIQNQVRIHTRCISNKILKGSWLGGLLSAIPSSTLQSSIFQISLDLVSPSGSFSTSFFCHQNRSLSPPIGSLNLHSPHIPHPLIFVVP